MTARNPVSSMTAFARAEGQVDGHAWAVEVKSVNGRGLDVRCRMPPGFDALEPVARTLVGRHVKRGSVSVGATVTRASAGGPLRVNRAFLDELVAVARDYGADAPRIDTLLTVRGVVESADDGADDEDGHQRLADGLSAGLSAAVSQLVEGRLAEGRHLDELIRGHLDAIATLTDAAARTAAAQPEQLQQRLKTQLEEILGQVPGLAPERLAQEVAILVGRGDIREEIDRLRAHIDGARALLAEGGAIGRRLDFLCQEFNREANTLCSKSSDVALTRIGLDLKAAIEQLREQVQNVE